MAKPYAASAPPSPRVLHPPPPPSPPAAIPPGATPSHYLEVRVAAFELPLLAGRFPPPPDAVGYHLQLLRRRSRPPDDAGSGGRPTASPPRRSLLRGSSALAAAAVAALDPSAAASEFELLGATETVRGDPNPSWVTAFRLPAASVLGPRRRPPLPPVDGA